MMPWPVELGPEFVHGAKSSLKVGIEPYVLFAGRSPCGLSLTTKRGRRACWRRLAATCASSSGQTTGTLVQSVAWWAPECRCVRCCYNTPTCCSRPCLCAPRILAGRRA